MVARPPKRTPGPPGSPPGLVRFGGLATIEDDLQSAQTWSHQLSLIKQNTKNSVSKNPENLGRPTDQLRLVKIGNVISIQMHRLWFLLSLLMSFHESKSIIKKLETTLLGHFNSDAHTVVKFLSQLMLFIVSKTFKKYMK